MTVSHSSAKAELRAMVLLIAEVRIFLRINIIFMENRKSSGQPGKIAKIGPCRTGAVR